MKRPSRKEIRESLDKLSNKTNGPAPTPEKNVGKPAPQKSSQRIRKQGI